MDSPPGGKQRAFCPACPRIALIFSTTAVQAQQLLRGPDVWIQQGLPERCGEPALLRLLHTAGAGKHPHLGVADALAVTPSAPQSRRRRRNSSPG